MHHKALIFFYHTKTPVSHKHYTNNFNRALNRLIQTYHSPPPDSILTRSMWNMNDESLTHERSGLGALGIDTRINPGMSMSKSKSKSKSKDLCFCDLYCRHIPYLVLVVH